MRIGVMQVAGNGAVRYVEVDTAGRQDAERWERLVEDAALKVPPPYRAEPGRPVYEICVGECIAHVGEGDLTGPLRALVIAVLAEGGH